MSTLVNLPKAEPAPEKPVRTIPEIQADYQALCTRAGHVQYQIVTLEKDLAAVNESLRDLNLEASKVQADQAAAKAAEGTSNA